ncbi:hypothetical protein CAL7716_071660 [Calothrix sp. PCC 7716]|nr:hypothetical protein CAL7716_071660 [Calothrix sp. PCC 7716]
MAYPQRVSKLVLFAPGLTGYQISPELVQHFQQIQAAVPDIEKMDQQKLHQVPQPKILPKISV